MKWIVFALGFILAVSGLVAISQGYDIIQVERGWTLVISGATAFSAGIVTVALGFVVARIETLIALSKKERNTIPLDDRASAHLAAASAGISLTEAAGAAAMAPTPNEPAPVGSPFASTGWSAAADAVPQQVANEPDLSVEDLGFSSLPEPAEEATALAAASPAPAPPGAAKMRPRATFVSPPRVPPKSIPAPGPWPSKPAPPVAEPEAPAHVAPVEAAPAEVAPVEATSGETMQGPRRNEHDWLEQALAGVESEENAESPPPAQDEAPGVAEPTVVPAAEEERAAPAVIGRYEANGASYVLFADGSIEAATESGIYRFASMAELKESIEGAA